MLDIFALSQQCAPMVHETTMAAIVKVESSFNPFAIGVVRGRLVRQPKDLPEAIATAKYLEKNGYNYSVGLAQINRNNFAHYNLTLESAFDPCTNLKVSALILSGCYQAARTHESSEFSALQMALSCYYSGNLQAKSSANYVEKVVASAPTTATPPIPVVPAPPTKAAGQLGSDEVGPPRVPALPPGAREPAPTTMAATHERLGFQTPDNDADIWHRKTRRHDAGDLRDHNNVDDSQVF